MTTNNGETDRGGAPEPDPHARTGSLRSARTSPVAPQTS
uniref:Uncharacterized protein n=1 Tax=Mycolicibacterium sp. CBMA 213 TaxID=1968788 RepID=A0A343VRF3_9MYCO|nr:hypothetical protein B5P44_p00182 [Mycolicibacterium sp. CBMA 213]